MILFFFVFFLRKKMMSFCFLMIVCVIFLSVFLIFGQKSANYDWFLSLSRREEFSFASICRLFARRIEKNTYYLLILVNMNYCLSLWFKLTTEKNVCLNENKTKIKNNKCLYKRTFWDEHWKKSQDLYPPCWLLTNYTLFSKTL